MAMALWCSFCCSPGSDWVDQFAHVSLDLSFSSGILVRRLNAHLIHAMSELSPSPTLPLSRMVHWVVHIWVLYNNFVRRIGLQKLAVGEYYVYYVCCSAVSCVKVTIHVKEL